MPPSILDETNNLVRLYLHYCGRTEVPTEFHLWAWLSVMAACVADRVWIEKFRGEKLAPNLYTILIGPSGLGKGQAIGSATRFVRDIPRINMYRGKSTAPALIDELSTKRFVDGKKVAANTKFFLVTPELSMSTGSGDLADSFIKLMCEIFEGGSYTFKERTRTSGFVSFRDFTINWLAGTVLEWLTDCVTREAIQGGFFARTIAISAPYNTDVRYVKPMYPPDRDEVGEEIARRIRQLACLGGCFTQDEEAQRIEDQWYMTRPAPAEDELLPAWRRDHDLMLKLAMLLALADDYDLTIRAPHVIRAQKLVAAARRVMPSLISYSSTTPESDGMLQIERIIQRANVISHSGLLRVMSRRGMTSDRLRSLVETLIQAKKVSRTMIGERQAVAYVWRG
jgi:hypothetical protein